jgi:competence protein ComEA
MKNVFAMFVSLVVPALVFAGPVNVNTADAETISRELKGIGQAKAQAIVEYRETNGAFTAPEELLQVKGIGTRVLTDNGDDIIIAD